MIKSKITKSVITLIFQFKEENLTADASELQVRF